MRGTQKSGGDTNRCLVEIRVAPRPAPGHSGMVHPPATNGIAHPSNPLVAGRATGWMGMNTLGVDPGLFCMVFPDRLPEGDAIFARVYNAPTVAEATFYADTHPVTIPGPALHFVAVAFRPAQPIDWRDCNGDGRANSWERFLAQEAAGGRDTDGDGVSDYHEWLAGTDMHNADCFLAFRFIGREWGLSAPAGAGDGDERSIRVRWRSVPGRAYQMENATHLGWNPATGEAGVFEAIGEPIVAGENEVEIERVIEVPEGPSAGYFRVRVLAD